MNIPECWRKRRKTPVMIKEKRKGTRQKPVQEMPGSHKAELLLRTGMR
jgi:hypothetical protein